MCAPHYKVKNETLLYLGRNKTINQSRFWLNLKCDSTFSFGIDMIDHCLCIDKLYPIWFRPRPWCNIKFILN